MNTDTINVLHIMGFADAGGISAVVLNYYSFIDRDRFHFDIALTGGKPGMLGKVLQNEGVSFYELPLKSNGLKEYQIALHSLLTTNQYDVIHVHAGGTAYIDLKIARECGIPVRIAHAHSAGRRKSLYSRVRFAASAIFNPIFATKLAACGILAGECTFGKYNMRSSKGIVIPNAIDCGRFAFNVGIREQIRGKLHIEDRYVVGMVGRLSYEKNHRFALRIIRELQKTIPEVLLLILGDGEEKESIQTSSISYGLENNIVFLGRHTDIEKYYQAFDVLLLPSLYEGFPMAGVEGLASGLPVLFSDAITDELSFGSGAYYLPLELDRWVNQLIQLYKKDNTSYRVIRQNEVKQNGLDIHDTVKLLEAVYSEKK